MSELARYWAWVGGNIGAMPLEALLTVVAGLVFRRPLTRLGRWLMRELHSDTHVALRDLRLELAALKNTAEKTRQHADAAHRIAADTHEQLTGRRHPEAPGRKAAK